MDPDAGLIGIAAGDAAEAFFPAGAVAVLEDHAKNDKGGEQHQQGRIYYIEQDRKHVRILRAKGGSGQGEIIEYMS